MKGRGRAPRVCVVSPTRRAGSADQPHVHADLPQNRHFVTTVYGGTPYGPQIRELRGGTDVLSPRPAA